LMAVEGAIFNGSFERIIFSTLCKNTFNTFKEPFEERTKTSDDSRAFFVQFSFRACFDFILLALSHMHDNIPSVIY
jgi:hypothetical protein